MNPRPESRIANLESRTATIEATLLELSSDTAEELRVIKQDIKQVNDGMIASFKQIGEIFDRNFERFDTVEARLDRIEKDVADIKSTQEKILDLLQKKLGE